MIKAVIVAALAGVVVGASSVWAWEFLRPRRIPIAWEGVD